jgi:hypothetical protein
MANWIVRFFQTCQICSSTILWNVLHAEMELAVEEAGESQGGCPEDNTHQEGPRIQA